MAFVTITPLVLYGDDAADEGAEDGAEVSMSVDAEDAREITAAFGTAENMVINTAHVARVEFMLADEVLGPISIIHMAAGEETQLLVTGKPEDIIVRWRMFAFTAGGSL